MMILTLKFANQVGNKGAKLLLSVKGLS